MAVADCLAWSNIEPRPAPPPSVLPPAATYPKESAAAMASFSAPAATNHAAWGPTIRPWHQPESEGLDMSLVGFSQIWVGYDHAGADLG